MIFAFAFPLILLVVIVGVSGDEPDPDFRGAVPADFYIPSYLAVVIASLGLISLPVHLATYRERGITRRFRASAVAPGK